MQVRVLHFAAARDRAGCAEESAELPEGATVGVLSTWLGDRHSALRPLLGHVRFAVNQTFARSETALADGDEVAVIPPVSGG